jgi:multidrug efflux pump subunit AcrA (membrane-fusion protein)
MGRGISIVLVLAVVGALIWVGNDRVQDLAKKPARRGGGGAVPVEVAFIERGPIEHRRTFTGTLDPKAEFVVAPKVSGRVEQLHVDLADTVTRGQLVAKLDDDEYVQSVAQAEADFLVAKANLAEAGSLLNIAERELKRVEKLRERGVASESQRDTAKADQLAKQAHVAVTGAQVTRAEASLEAARIRLGYSKITAGWPITSVFIVTELDYALLRTGQLVTLRTDAHPDAAFQGLIARIAPVFRESTRQARVEVDVDNAELRLRPGMFVRVTVVLDRVEDATIVPEQALVRRDGRDGVFVVAGDGQTVAWREVEVGFRQGGRVQVTGDGLNTQVVTLGQQLLEDNSAVSVAERMHSRTP